MLVRRAKVVGLMLVWPLIWAFFTVWIYVEAIPYAWRHYRFQVGSGDGSFKEGYRYLKNEWNNVRS